MAVHSDGNKNLLAPYVINSTKLGNYLYLPSTVSIPIELSGSRHRPHSQLLLLQLNILKVACHPLSLFRRPSNPQDQSSSSNLNSFLPAPWIVMILSLHPKTRKLPQANSMGS